MTQEQFAKYSYRHSEVIIFHEKHPEITFTSRFPKPEWYDEK